MKDVTGRANSSTKRAVCVVSSLHPIELTSFLMLKRLKALPAGASLLILYMDDRHKPSIRRNAFLSSHDALPVPLLLQDRDDIRQIFLPLSCDREENRNTVLGFLAAHERALPKTLTKGARRKLTDRHGQALGARSPLQTSDLIIHALQKGWRSGRILVAAYEHFLEKPSSQAAVNRALGALCAEMSRDLRDANTELAFSRGGFIAARYDGGELRFDRPALGGPGLIVTGEASGWSIAIAPAAENNSVQVIDAEGRLRRDDVVLDLRGPLLMAYQHQLGIVIDAPWYLEQVHMSDGAGVYSAIEVISPVSPTCSQRASDWAGGGSLRLRPGGYSLLDYPSPAALSFVRETAKLAKSTKWTALSDWRHLCEHYPRTNQKIQKSQAAVGEYVSRREREAFDALRAGDVRTLRELTAVSLPKTPYLGATGLRLLALHRLLRAWVRSDRSVHPTKSQQRLLDRAGPLTGIVNDHLPRKMNEIAGAIRLWRKTVVIAAEDQPAWMTSESFDVRAFEASLDLLHHRSTEGSTPSDLPAHQDLRDEIERYYRVVAALCASVFKMHIFNATLLFTPEQFSRLASVIARQRQSPTLPLTGPLWTARPQRKVPAT